MAEFTEQDRLDALREIKTITEEIAAIDKERAKNKGIFLSSIQKEIIEFERAKQLQQDIVTAAEEQAEIERLRRDILKEQAFLNQAQNLDANKKLQVDLKIANLAQRRIDALADQAKFFNEMAAAATKDIKDSTKKAKVASDIAAIQLKIKQNQVSPKEAKRLLAIQTKIAEELKKQEERLQGITNSVADTTAGFANLLGIETGFSKGLDNILDGIISMADEIEESGIAEVGKRVAEGISESINLTNVLGSIAKSAFEQVMGILDMTADITAATGMSQDFVLSFERATTRANEMAGAVGALRSEMFEAGKVLTQTLQVFTTLGESARVEITAIAGNLSRIGVDTADFSEAIADSMALTGRGAVEAAKEVEQLTKHMLAFGISPQESVRNLATMAGKFAHLGAAGRKQLVELTKTAKALNIQLDDTIGHLEQFDTLEQSIEASRSLNAIFQRLTGTTQQFFNPQELAMETNLDKRFAMLRKNFEATGLTLEEMANSGLREHRFALKAISEAMGGIPIDELIKTYGQADRGTLEAAQSQKSFNELLHEARSPTDMLKAMFESLIQDGTLITLAKSFTSLAKTVANLAQTFGPLIIPFGIFVGVLGSLLGISKVILTLKAIGAAFNITAISSLGFAASLGYVLAGIAAIAGLYVIFSSFGDFVADTFGPATAAALLLATAIGAVWVASTAGTAAASIIAGLVAVSATMAGLGQGLDALGISSPDLDITGNVGLGEIEIPEMPKFSGEGGFEIPALQTGGRIKGDGIAYLHADEEVMTPAEVEKKEAAGTTNSNISGDLVNTILSPSMNMTVGQGIVQPNYSTTTNEMVDPDELGRAIAAHLKPLLAKLGSEVAAAAAQGDVMLDGKKVGVAVAPKAVKAMEKKMQRMLIG